METCPGSFFCGFWLARSKPLLRLSIYRRSEEKSPLVKLLFILPLLEINFCRHFCCWFLYLTKSARVMEAIKERGTKPPSSSSPPENPRGIWKQENLNNAFFPVDFCMSCLLLNPRSHNTHSDHLSLSLSPLARTQIPKGFRTSFALLYLWWCALSFSLGQTLSQHKK